MSTTPTEPPTKLYVYDHCPYCTRARMIFGLKNVEHVLVFVSNHDEATPIGLVDAKQVPILQLPSGKAFPESLDIVRYVDEYYGGPFLLKEASGREDLQQWFLQIHQYLHRLLYPRKVAAPFAEFAFRVSREYFQNKKEKTVGPFKELVAKTLELVTVMDAILLELDGLLASEKTANADGVSYDDITVFGSIRCLTLVKDLTWPTKVRAYVDHFSQVAGIPLLTAMAKF